MNGWLSASILIPFAAALALLGARRASREFARGLALAASTATLLATLVLAYQFVHLPVPSNERPSPVEPRYVTNYPWLSYGDTSGEAVRSRGLHFDFLLGLDGISLVLIVLTSILTVPCVLISWESIRDRAAGFYACLLLLEAGLIGVFCAFDLVLFYVFFEFTLIPLFFMIGIWGGPQRRYAAIKFFLYTLTGSLVTLVGLVALVLTAWTGGVATPCSVPAVAQWLAANPLSATWQVTLFLTIAVGFLVKVPVFPLHTWLPLAHVEAPTAGSVLLAGVLLKLGTYGFLRLCLPMFPHACLAVGIPLIAVLSVIGIIYGSLCALGQRDIKKLVAYSSVAHLGFCMLGVFALNTVGISGGVLQMINHGLSTGGLFLLVGMIYDRYHTRQLDDLGGLAAKLPLLACTMVFISLASVGLPGLNGFVGEMLSLAGMFRRQPVYTVLGATGVILGAWYLLNMLQHVFFGPLREPHVGESAAADSHHVRRGGRGDEPPISDITPREMLAIGPICALCLWIGVMPQPLIELIRPDVDAIVTLYTADERGMASADRQNMGAEHGASKHHARRLGIRDVPRGKAPDNMPRVADWPSSPQSSAVTESRPAVTALGPRLSALISQPSTLNPPQ
jgi:NADH-quinone oxidoreductase subunit M